MGIFGGKKVAEAKQQSRLVVNSVCQLLSGRLQVVPAGIAE